MQTHPIIAITGTAYGGPLVSQRTSIVDLASTGIDQVPCTTSPDTTSKTADRTSPARQLAA